VTRRWPCAGAGAALPGVPLDRQRERDLIWIRKRFLQTT
jgi:hypothetical protein